MPRQGTSGSLWREPPVSDAVAGVGRFVAAGAGLGLTAAGPAVAELRRVGGAYRLLDLADRYVVADDPAHPGALTLALNGVPARQWVRDVDGHLVLGSASATPDAEFFRERGSDMAVLTSSDAARAVWLRVGDTFYLH